MCPVWHSKRSLKRQHRAPLCCHWLWLNPGIRICIWVSEPAHAPAPVPCTSPAPRAWQIHLAPHSSNAHANICAEMQLVCSCQSVRHTNTHTDNRTSALADSQIHPEGCLPHQRKVQLVQVATRAQTARLHSGRMRWADVSQQVSKKTTADTFPCRRLSRFLHSL